MFGTAGDANPSADGCLSRPVVEGGGIGSVVFEGNERVLISGEGIG